MYDIVDLTHAVDVQAFLSQEKEMMPKAAADEVAVLRQKYAERLGKEGCVRKWEDFDALVEKIATAEEKQRLKVAMNTVTDWDRVVRIRRCVHIKKEDLSRVDIFKAIKGSSKIFSFHEREGGSLIFAPRSCSEMCDMCVNHKHGLCTVRRDPVRMCAVQKKYMREYVEENEKMREWTCGEDLRKNVNQVLSQTLE